MKLWMSAEFSGDIGDGLRLARNFVEDEINTVIEAKDYDIELDGWDCIAIIMESDSDFEEVIKYSIKKRDMDFRLRICFENFANADALGQQRLIYQMLLRSLDLLIEKGVNVSGINALRADVEGIAKKFAWS
jgi:hypothetical protein